MELKVFNCALLAGWLMMLVGACLLNFAAGILWGGISLVALTVHIAGKVGVTSAQKEES